MTRNGMLAISALGTAMVAGGLLLQIGGGGGVPLLLLGAMILLTVFLEQRYRGTVSGPIGPQWERTSERFRDEETGKWMEVWFNPQSGERRYVASGDNRVT